MGYSQFNLMLYVERVDRSVEFYRDVLGFDFEGWGACADGTAAQSFEEAGRPEYVDLHAGSLSLSLHQKDSPRPSGAVFHLRADDLESLHGRLRDMGIDSGEPTDQPWGWRMLDVLDPDGHEWSFYMPLKKDM